MECRQVDPGVRLRNLNPGEHNVWIDSVTGQKMGYLAKRYFIQCPDEGNRFVLAVFYPAVLKVPSGA